jgi:hypothetical protein
MNGFLGMVCNRESGKRIFRKRFQDKIVAFMMAWHPRLGQDAQISYYVPKIVAKEIIAKIFIRHCEECLKRQLVDQNMYLSVPIHDVKFKMNDGLSMTHPNTRVIRHYVQSPYMLLSADVEEADIMKISFEEHPKFTELMDSIIQKMAEVYPSSSWPGCSHEFKLSKSVGFFQSKTYKGTVAHHVNRLKKGTKVRMIFEYLNQSKGGSYEWTVSQLQIQ